MLNLFLGLDFLVPHQLPRHFQQGQIIDVGFSFFFLPFFLLLKHELASCSGMAFVAFCSTNTTPLSRLQTTAD
jgi:hypothetical protein